MCNRVFIKAYLTCFEIFFRLFFKLLFLFGILFNNPKDDEMSIMNTDSNVRIFSKAGKKHSFTISTKSINGGLLHINLKPLLSWHGDHNAKGGMHCTRFRSKVLLKQKLTHCMKMNSAETMFIVCLTIFQSQESSLFYSDEQKWGRVINLRANSSQRILQIINSCVLKPIINLHNWKLRG